MSRLKKKKESNEDILFKNGNIGHFSIYLTSDGFIATLVSLMEGAWGDPPPNPKGENIGREFPPSYVQHRQAHVQWA